MEIDVVESGGKFSGELRSLDQNNATLKIDDIVSDGKSLSFSIPQLGAKFSGKFGKDKNTVGGTFSQSGANLPLVLTKATSKSLPADKSESMPEEKPEEALKEAWVGELNLGIMKPVMQFRVVELESGETAAYFDSITEGRTGFKATWSLEDNKLNFDVAQIKLAYRGTVSEAGDTAEGVWSQGGRELPLTLKKQLTEYNSKKCLGESPAAPCSTFSV